VELFLDNGDITTVDLNLVNNFKKVSISSVDVISCQVEADWFELMDISISSLSDYSKVRNFIYYQKDFSDEAIDLTPMKDLQNGIFYVEKCTNYECLRNLKSLDINSCNR
jgi:hypothetical protein